MTHVTFKQTRSTLFAMAAASLLAGCGGGGADTAPASSLPTQQMAADSALPSTESSTSSESMKTALAVSTIKSVATPKLTIRARGDLALGVGPLMTVKVNGSVIATVEVKSTTWNDYTFDAPALGSGAKVDIVFTNDTVIHGQDRNLYVASLTDGQVTVLPNGSTSVIDRGIGALAFNGLDTLPGQVGIYWNAALRLNWPATTASTSVEQKAAARFLMQASFGPTRSEIDRVAAMSPSAWITQQMAMPATSDFVNAIQSKYDLGNDYRPYGSKFNVAWVNRQFWSNVVNSPDQLRKRVGFSLHEILVVSQMDSVVWQHVRAYANYLDILNRDAFGNYRKLLEDVALTPAMGLYLSHMRNRKEDPATGRLPDENFAREIMQLFSIGLHDLNLDGTPKLDGNGKPIETYSTADVMALAKVFTGWSWAFPDSEMTDSVFRWKRPEYSVDKDTKVDLQPMKAYPGESSTSPKVLFAGKPYEINIPADTSGPDSLRMALDGLFKHPNVGPFVARQLIQRLVTSAPSPAYVARVASTFNNNGNGVRGDMAAVVRAILLDAEARDDTPPASFGKLREPALRVAHWMRAFGASSTSNSFMMSDELGNLSDRPMYASSVFGYFRPGYVPPNTAFSNTASTAPEFQIVDESSTAAWVNLAMSMTGSGIGWNGTSRDVYASYATQANLAGTGNLTSLLDNIDLLMFAGHMSSELRTQLQVAISSVPGNDAASQLNRARTAIFLSLASPEFLIQR